MAGLGLVLDDLNDSLLKVFLRSPTLGDIGLLVLGLGGTSKEWLS